MSCPNYCSNNFKIKNIPDEIECVVASKVATNSTDPSGVLLDLPSFGNLKRIVTGVSGGPVEIGADPSAILVAIENGELSRGELFIAIPADASATVGIVQIVQ